MEGDSRDAGSFAIFVCSPLYSFLFWATLYSRGVMRRHHITGCESQQPVSCDQADASTDQEASSEVRSGFHTLVFRLQ